MPPLNLPASLVHGDEPFDGEEEFVEAAPVGEPTGVAVVLAQQAAAEAGEVADEVSDGGQLSLAERAEHFPPDRRDDSRGGEVGGALPNKS